LAEKFYTILTNTGKAKIANATALGDKVNFTTLKAGDSNGNYYNPTETQEDLIHEVWQGNINSITTDPDNPNWIVVEVIIPSSVGGFIIREVGIFDDAGDMLAIGKYPETYKPQVADGSTKDITIRMILEVSNSASVTLKVDPTVTLATKTDFYNLAGSGRTTETVKGNADVISKIGQQVNNIKFFSQPDTPDSESIDSSKTNIWFDTANNLIKIWNGTSWQGQGAVYQE
jgi:phage-related tail fiber protein